MKKNTIWLIAGLSVCTMGCKDDPQTNDVSDRSDYEGRGSEICQDWQYTLCKFMAEKCGLSDAGRAQCEEQYSSFECVSDTVASECVDAFESASSCDEALYFQCYWQSVADPQPAMDGCDALNTAQCNRVVGCDSSITMDDCLTDLEADVDCSTAVGLSDNYEGCLSAVQDWACVDPAPEVCTGVILSM